MPWKENRKVDQRIEFVLKALRSTNFRQLCQEYGISAKTGYKWREKFLERGMGGMGDESRRPLSHSKELPEGVVCEMIRLKQAHPNWGPRKIWALYGRKHGKQTPSESSFKRVLERAGLTQKCRRKRSKEGGRISSGRKAEGPNDVWTVDFKGWWLDQSSKRVEPLTVRDEYSRMILEVRAVAKADQKTVRPCFERLFERHGLPEAIRSDNGPPFASYQGLLGLTRLSAWWVALGIDLERGRPGCPQDNGAHERMHLDIMKELESKGIGRDQEAFDQWRLEFNQERPHESLGMAFPSEIYCQSKKNYEGTPDELDYEGMVTRRVNSVGTISYQGERIAISSALAGWDVGLRPTEQEGTEVWFGRLQVGEIQEETASFRAARTGRSEAEKLKAKQKQ
jgi:putative transposase